MQTSFEAFSKEVKDSIENHAHRKNYLPEGQSVNEANPLQAFMLALGINTGHNIGELIYKAVEYVKHPRRVLMVKAAGWAYLEWRNCDKE